MLHAAKLLNGNVEDMRKLPAGEIFNSILPAVNIDIGDSEDLGKGVNEGVLTKQADMRNEEILAEEKAFEKKKAEFLLTKGSKTAAEGVTGGNGTDAQNWEGIGNPSEAKGLMGFVKSFEGFVGKATPDGRQTSIGYGTRAKKGEFSISRADAEIRLASELGTHRKNVLDVVRRGGYKFGKAQIDALVSFDFNNGSVGKLLLAKGKRRFSSNSQIAKKMLEYDKADLDGKGLKSMRGLTRRRTAESRIFLNNRY